MLRHAVFFIVFLSGCLNINNAAVSTKTNVLFIMMDDLRPLFKSYGLNYMITPNIDILASRSVLFENAFCAVPVCSPSRNSLVTGLKPETIHSYGFENTFAPHISFPEHFRKINYNLAGYGKIYHSNDIEGNLPGVGYGIDESKWYDYQALETGLLNSTVNPDRHTPEKNFRDYDFTSRALSGLRDLAMRPQYFFLALGFKMPHIHLHFPHRYFEMYRPHKSVWENISPKYLRFPPSSPAIAYQCCALNEYRYMMNEGDAKSRFSEPQINLINMSLPKPNLMHTELMWAYSASITFLDAQIGRLLAVLDELQLWNNITIVLTSDHGMHNGEKGLWEKWNLFEESTRVPLMIYHPQSPFKGQRYLQPVEHIDLYPTLLDLAGESQLHGDTCPPKNGRRRAKICHPLEGQSLVPVLLGLTNEKGGAVEMGTLAKTYAVTQVIRCAKRAKLHTLRHGQLSKMARNNLLVSLWEGCGAKEVKEEMCVMGYSLRTASFRYTAYLPFNRTTHHIVYQQKGGEQPPTAVPVYEELYDHRRDHNTTLYQREMVNLARHVKYKPKLDELLAQLVTYLKRDSPPLFGVLKSKG